MKRKGKPLGQRLILLHHLDLQPYWPTFLRCLHILRNLNLVQLAIQAQLSQAGIVVLGKHLIRAYTDDNNYKIDENIYVHFFNNCSLEQNYNQIIKNKKLKQSKINTHR